MEFVIALFCWTVVLVCGVGFVALGVSMFMAPTYSALDPRSELVRAAERRCKAQGEFVRTRRRPVALLRIEDPFDPEATLPGPFYQPRREA